MQVTDLASESYQREGVWHDIEHKPYKDQSRAANPEHRAFVDRLIRDRIEGGAPAPATHTGREDEIVVQHQSKQTD